MPVSCSYALELLPKMVQIGLISVKNNLQCCVNSDMIHMLHQIAFAIMNNVQAVKCNNNNLLTKYYHHLWQ